jgi:threonyl-tRNA synthetase
MPNHASHQALRHSLSHVAAQAVLEILPGSTLAFGGYNDDREEIYYTLATTRPLTPDHFPALESRMRQIIAANLTFQQRYVSPAEARELFLGHPYKLEVIEELAAGRAGYDEAVDAQDSPGERGHQISTFQHGSFIDVCAGPHVETTKQIAPDSFRLTRVEAVRWRYDAANALLYRLYLTAFGTKDELESHFERLATREAEFARRRHDLLGPRLGLFLHRDQEVTDPDHGPVPLSVWAPGSPFFLPKGAVVYNLLIDHMRRLYLSYGYQEVISPQVFSWRLFELSGHAEVYKAKMYHFDLGGEHLALKPMNCPGHALMYAATRRSYNDLPIRLADFGRLHRLEDLGALRGITRTRSFAQDDSHIFCRQDQVEAEVQAFMKLLREVYELFFDLTHMRVMLSTRPDPAERVGDDAMWESGERVLDGILRNLGVPFVPGPKEGAFYGPKIDFEIHDALGRPTQLATIQLDYSLPARMKLEYVTAQGTRDRPVILHRAVLGSLERFIGLVVEHLEGAFPAWLAPVQVTVIPVVDRNLEYAKQVSARLEAEGIRVELDARGERMQAKIRDAELAKVPYMLVVGDRNMRDGTVTPRLRSGTKAMDDLPLGTFVGHVKDIVGRRSRSLWGDPA